MTTPGGNEEPAIEFGRFAFFHCVLIASKSD